MSRMRLAVTMGDPAGIGSEIVVKALNRPEIYERCVPIVIGDLDAIQDALRLSGIDLAVNVIKEPCEAKGSFGTIDLVDMGLVHIGDWTYKQVGAKAGEAAFQYVVHAIRLAQANKVEAVATGPICKESINLAGHHYSGHTEIFAEYTGTHDYAMLLMGGGLRVIHVTTHVSMQDACKLVTQERVYSVIRLADTGARLLGIAVPEIGVAGLNAHCSENGLFGTQEKEAIIPAISRAQQEGLKVTGPVPPDTVFVKALAGTFDVVVAMYHDQGHIPLKLCGFRMDPETKAYSAMSGVNCTIGLPFIRSSVDHGTAFGKAGDNRANEESMVEAIEAAVTMTVNRKKLGI